MARCWATRVVAARWLTSAWKVTRHLNPHRLPGLGAAAYHYSTLRRSKQPSPPHVPVLLAQVLDVLSPQAGQVVVDCTVGCGGHAAAILSRLGPAGGGGRLIGLDLDELNINIARSKLEAVGGRFDLFHSNFAGLPAVLERAGVIGGRVDAIFADIGIASTQIDDPARGFSYRRPGPLDMRMDTTRGVRASDLVNTMSERELAAAFIELGDESDGPEIARLIVQRRAISPIVTTQELMAIVCEARDFTLQRAAGAKLHPAARTFQALRILVNTEIANLNRLLAMLTTVLKPGGIAVIITFHSGEDRPVKHFFRDGFRAGIFSHENRDPIIADEDERENNSRSRAAKLRYARLAMVPPEVS